MVDQLLLSKPLVLKVPGMRLVIPHSGLARYHKLRPLLLIQKRLLVSDPESLETLLVKLASIQLLIFLFTIFTTYLAMNRRIDVTQLSCWRISCS